MSLKNSWSSKKQTKPHTQGFPLYLTREMWHKPIKSLDDCRSGPLSETVHGAQREFFLYNTNTLKKAPQLFPTPQEFQHFRRQCYRSAILTEQSHVTTEAQSTDVFLSFKKNRHFSITGRNFFNLWRTNEAKHQLLAYSTKDFCILKHASAKVNF